MSNDTLRLPAEELYKDEIVALIAEDKEEKPANWQMSPRQVLKFIIGGKAGKTVITPKYIGQKVLPNNIQHTPQAHFQE